jgi:hypothetical protein
LDEGLRYADEIEQSYCRHVLAATSAHVAWAAVRWDEAVHVAGQELVERGSRRGTLGSRDVLGFVAFGRGDVERARALLDDSLAIGGRTAGRLVLPVRASEATSCREPRTPSPGAADTDLLTHERRALLVPFVVTGVPQPSRAAPDLASDGWTGDRCSPTGSRSWPPSTAPTASWDDGLAIAART